MRKRLPALYLSDTSEYIDANVFKMSGRYEILELLLAHGGDPNVVDIDDWSPLMWSCSRGHAQCVQVNWFPFVNHLHHYKFAP